MTCTHVWALVALVLCCVHSYTEGKTLDELYLKPLEPLWYEGQPYPACEAIIAAFYYDSKTDVLNHVSKKQCRRYSTLYIRGVVFYIYVI